MILYTQRMCAEQTIYAHCIYIKSCSVDRKKTKWLREERSVAHCGLLEVVEHAFFENEPPLVLRLVLASLLRQPTLPLGVKERLGQIPVSVRYLELLFAHVLKELLHLCWYWYWAHPKTCTYSHGSNNVASWSLREELRKGFYRVVWLTLRNSGGRSPPLLMPLFMEMNRSTVGLSFTLGLWRLVWSMMIA